MLKRDLMKLDQMFFQPKNKTLNFNDFSANLIRVNP
ncbi:hypothetical protein MED217_17140 [Leeuwenhoekiella blandensis MED217]|uniref:Uncharacterized protein n=1 Tax=Leeuwenhoekiella blandensis (strain CECT 7118 / CCUG 51940 / KCTC 22103 / MED217) TaxID=398720 RepID=A3XHF3_LEEBM|nr:hypothetical protein MED217_17140 [Leeuwenhoekiella blandensis MED217]